MLDEVLPAIAFYLKYIKDLTIVFALLLLFSCEEEFELQTPLIFHLLMKKPKLLFTMAKKQANLENLLKA